MKITISSPSEFKSEEILLPLDIYSKLFELDKVPDFLETWFILNLKDSFNFTKGCMFISDYLRKKSKSMSISMSKIINPPSPFCKFNFVYPVNFKSVKSVCSSVEIELEVLRLDLVQHYRNFKIEEVESENDIYVQGRGPIYIVKFSFDREEISSESDILFSILMNMYNELDTLD